MNPRLALRAETLTELTPADLAAVAGGTTSDTTPTYLCTPIANAVVAGAKRATHELTLLDCG